MREDRACRYEPEAARELEQRENRGGGGGGNVCASPRWKAASSAVVASAARTAGAFAVSIPSTGLSSAKQISPTKWAVIHRILPKRL